MSSASHSQPDPDWKWKKHQPRIRHLFYDKKLKPEEIRDRMRSLDFVPSIKEFKDRLESWGYRRNDTRETREYISHKVKKRDRQNKRSAVVVNGNQWPEKKVRQQASRNPRKMLDIVRAPSPSTPPGPVVSVCSPIFDDPKAYISYEWSPNLPWLRFTSLVSEAPIDILGIMGKRLCIVHLEPGVQDLATSGTLSTLQLAAHQLGLSLPEGIFNPLKLSRYLQSIMPESYPGEHLLRSQNFAKGFDIAAREILSLGLYQLSNKAISNDGRRNELLVDIIRQSGLVGLTHPIFSEPTIRSVLEGVGLAALCCCQSGIVTWILDVGINLAVISRHSPLAVAASRMHHRGGPNKFCPSGRFCGHSGLVSNHDGIATIRVLLAHGVSPGGRCCDEHGTPLEVAIRDGLLDIVKVFVDHGRKAYGPGYLRDMDFSRLFLLPHWDTPFAKQHSMLDYIRALFDEDSLARSDPFGPLLSAEGLIAAALNGGRALLNILRARGANFNCKNPRGEHPLGALVASRIRGTIENRPQDSERQESQRCKALVELGAMVDYGPIREDGQGTFPSAIHLASFLGDRDILDAFLKPGPCQHTPASFYVDGYWLYGLKLEAREEGTPSQISLGLVIMEEVTWMRPPPFEVRVSAFINRGIELDSQSSSGKTALDIAISKEQFEIANVLVLGGATKNIAIPMDQTNVFDTCGWLDHLTRLTIPDIELCAEEERNKRLEDWCQLYPCESVTSQNSRLGELSKRIGGWDSSNLHFTIFKFVLERYHHAYSSFALERWLVYVLKIDNKYEDWSLILQTIHELLRRRRPEFVTPKAELLALDTLMIMMIVSYDTKSVRLLGVLEVLLQQDPRLGHIDLNPWENPLCWTPLLGVQNQSRSNEAMEFYGSVGDLLLGSGFTVNTAVGLRAIGRRCTADELEKLMHHGYDPRRRYRWSNTALQLAAMNNDLDMVRYLLKHEVNVNGRPRWGEYPWVGEDDDMYSNPLNDLESSNRRTAFQYAVENNSWECAQLLLEFGANVNASPARMGGATALQLAAMKGRIRLVRWLISEKADIFAQGAPINGMTAIEGAASFGKLDVVGLLFEYGNFCNGEGRRQCIRAIGYARNNRYEALRSFMEDHIGWSQEDEHTLAQEDLLEAFEFFPDSDTEDDHQGCVGETESVDEGMDEPECCRQVGLSDSKDEEPIDSDQCVPENEGLSTMEYMPEGWGEGTQTPYRGENGQRMVGEDRMDVAARAYDAGFDGFSENLNLGSMDLGFLPDSYPGYEVPDAPGVVIGEIFDNEEWLNELYSEWTEPDDQGSWIDPGDGISGNQLDFSEFL
ncbi:hypothetical protein PG991_000067 [Apiospora marii]|uniref:Clr5 domain-containing protein n=1 Tax=Apiospora marii TaxID=335849 RepID=A0ABR1T305_9PEZI